MMEDTARVTIEEEIKEERPSSRPFLVFFSGLLTLVFAAFALVFFFQKEKCNQELKTKSEIISQLETQLNQAKIETEKRPSLQTENFTRVSLIIINQIETQLRKTWQSLLPNEPIISQTRLGETKSLISEGKEIVNAFTDLPEEAEAIKEELFALKTKINDFIPKLEGMTKNDFENEKKNNSPFYKEAIGLVNEKDRIKNELQKLSGEESSFKIVPYPTSLPSIFPSSGCTSCH